MAYAEIALIVFLLSLPILLLYLCKSSPRPLAGLVCVITGGAGEIGQEVCELLLREDVVVVIWDVSEENMDRMKKSDGLHIMNVDVSCYDSVSAGAEKVLQTLGRVDILINNAAIANPFDVEESTVEEIERAINVNLVSHFWTVKCLLPAIRKSPPFNGMSGSVVAISSVLGGVGTGGLQTYCAAKAGIIGFMESLYMQHPDIHWCIVTPFLVNTNLFKGMKHRFIDYIYPILDKMEVAEKIVDGIKYQRSCITIPWFWNYIFLLIKNLLPLEVTRFSEELFNVRLAYLQHHSRSG